jgi:hypothetical protein
MTNALHKLLTEAVLGLGTPPRHAGLGCLAKTPGPREGVGPEGGKEYPNFLVRGKQRQQSLEAHQACLDNTIPRLCIKTESPAEKIWWFHGPAGFLLGVRRLMGGLDAQASQVGVSGQVLVTPPLEHCDCNATINRLRPMGNRAGPTPRSCATSGSTVTCKSRYSVIIPSPTRVKSWNHPMQQLLPGARGRTNSHKRQAALVIAFFLLLYLVFSGQQNIDILF